MVETKTARWLLVLSLVVSSANAADRIRLINGRSVTGEIVQSSRNGLVIEAIDRTQKIPIVKIHSVLFEAEPAQLTQARINVANGGYETAIEKLAEAGDTAPDRELIQQEIEFLTAYSRTRLAAATGTNRIEAGRSLNKFVRSHPKSFHYYEAVEAIGDLFTSMKRFEQAEKSYRVIAAAPFKELKARAEMRRGDLLLVQSKPIEAARRFDAVLSMDPPKSLRTTAQLAKASALAASGDLDAGLEIARRLVLEAEQEDSHTLAAAYNTIGHCYQLADRPRDALYAYLHTDFLFSTDPDTHAEALGELIKLWQTAGKPEAARDARARLRRRYASSAAARKAG